MMVYITDRFKAILLIWFQVLACFGDSFCTVLPVCLYLRPKVTLHCLFIYLYRMFWGDIYEKCFINVITRP